MTALKTVVATFTVMGEPVSKARARFTGYGAKARAYTPEKTLAGERAVAAHFKAAAPGHVADATNAYEVDATFSHSTRQRRDVDNMVKLVFDGLNGVAWSDDNQVTDLSARKRLVEPGTAQTTVTVYRLGLFERRTRDCAHCGSPFDAFPSQSKKLYCSRECITAAKASQRTVNCEQCDSPFARKPSSMARFCSRACSIASKRRDVSCTHCGVTFSKQNCHVSERNFCSSTCQQAAMRPIRADRARGTCATCGGPTSKRQYTNCQAHARSVSGRPTKFEVAA